MTAETKPKIAKVSLARIRWDAGTQMRVALSEEYVQEIAEDVKRGDAIPPVTCFYDGANLWMADGFHRFHGFQEAGEQHIPAEIRKGSLDDAIFFASGCNKIHGLRRTREDKRNAVLMLLRNAAWGKMSARAIASHCSVAHSFVSDLRREYDAQPQPVTAEEPLSGPVVNEEHLEEMQESLDAPGGVKSTSNPPSPSGDSVISGGVKSTFRPPLQRGDGSDSGGVKSTSEAEQEEPITAPEVVTGRDGKKHRVAKEVTDQLGNELPKRLIPVFSEVPKFKALVASLGREIGHIRKLVDSTTGAGRALDIASVEGKGKAIQEALVVSAPYCLCPCCHGRGCGQCKATGWLTKFAYSFIPAAQKWSVDS